MTDKQGLSDDEGVVYLVIVDSRGPHHHAADLACYKEQTVSRTYFQTHIQRKASYVNHKSQVARLCGLDLELYFHDHPENKYACHSNILDEGHHEYNEINAIATLLTFEPNTGYYGHIVKDRAYVILNDGSTELSRRQVWGIQEFIRETKDYYHRDGHHYSHEAKMKLLGWAHDYVQGIWGPHSIYEPRHHAQSFHHNSSKSVENDDRHNSHPRRSTSDEKNFTKLDSGLTDQATCHHGATHGHHDGHHKCCRGGAKDDYAGISKHHVVAYSSDVAQQISRTNACSNRFHEILSSCGMRR